MADYNREPDGTVVRRSGAGRTIAIIAVVIVAIVALLFATGFWSADVKEGALPDVKVSADGGKLPDVNLDSKELVVGTKKTEIEVPKVKTETEEIDVPVVGVKDE
ncbi:hypothetical protein [Sphingobium boeckii]|uniref:FtsZ-interacting cell division protein ZipA n=1 Tax=Sphingobium boeckii TaxID=1082345 RepID=A0A7W9EF79_9SPHN|nr:hypothetical protein [Sphingobium boeckii]MBB5686794.1 FtsZ-interacting cell division protein ZipA [Sphingobium boeckii]